MHFCDLCKRRFDTSQALASHKRLKHHTIPVEEAKELIKAGKQREERIKQLEATIDQSKCPDCGMQVDWTNIPVEKHYEAELRDSDQSTLIPIGTKWGKLCPRCKYFEEQKK